jgi:GTP-binding protein YchF
VGFNCGIVGLPNVGKSSLFNALTSTSNAESANYPFCTIEPNVGKVSVPDQRLNKLASVAGSEKIMPAQLEFVDIAGIVKGASSGEGLGNKFLSNIRDTDAIIHLVRCFDDENIVHVSGRVDPISDIETIDTELLLSDLESIERRLESFAKKNKNPDKLSKETHEIMEMVYEHLKDGRPARCIKELSDEKSEILRQLQLLTSKPVLYVCNVPEDDVLNENEYISLVRKVAGDSPVVTISALIESEISQLSSEEEKNEFLKGLNLDEPGLSKVIRNGYSLLNLITYFTVGPKEARAWTIKNGCKAPQAAGAIHTDFERGFICSEVIATDDYLESGGDSGAKTLGKLRLEGKDYTVQDGDVMHFRFNV